MISVERMFRNTLDKVRKSHIGTVTPLTWNRLISEALKEFKRQFWLDYESNRANIDLIFPLKTFEANYDTESNLSDIPDDWWKPANIRVMVENNNNPILYPNLILPDMWIPCHEAKSGERDNIFANPFTGTNHKQCYFELRGNQIAFFPMEGLTVTKVELEYYKVPREIWFDQTAMPDNENYPLPNGAIDPYNAGYGSINTELSDDVRTLLIENASDIYLKEIGVLSPPREGK